MGLTNIWWDAPLTSTSSKLLSFTEPGLEACRNFRFQEHTEYRGRWVNEIISEAVRTQFWELESSSVTTIVLGQNGYML